MKKARNLLGYEPKTNMEEAVKKMIAHRGLGRAFLKAVIEKMLAKNKLDHTNKTNGLANHEFEIILGRKLLHQKTNKILTKEILITPEQFKKQSSNVDTSEFYRKLNTQIRILQNRTEPEAVNAVIELIALLSEPETLLDKSQKSAQIFDADTINKFLQAA